MNNSIILWNGSSCQDTKVKGSQEAKCLEAWMEPGYGRTCGLSAPKATQNPADSARGCSSPRSLYSQAPEMATHDNIHLQNQFQGQVPVHCKSEGLAASVLNNSDSRTGLGIRGELRAQHITVIYPSQSWVPWSRLTAKRYGWNNASLFQ